jgi:hypothetical protein
MTTTEFCDLREDRFRQSAIPHGALQHLRGLQDFSGFCHRVSMGSSSSPQIHGISLGSDFM